MRHKPPAILDGSPSADRDGSYSTVASNDLHRSSAHNPAKAAGTITHMGGSVTWARPAYDLNGNMTDMPIPGNETVVCFRQACLT